MNTDNDQGSMTKNVFGAAQTGMIIAGLDLRFRCRVIAKDAQRLRQSSSIRYPAIGPRNTRTTQNTIAAILDQLSLPAYRPRVWQVRRDGLRRGIIRRTCTAWRRRSTEVVIDPCATGSRPTRERTLAARQVINKLVGLTLCCILQIIFGIGTPSERQRDYVQHFSESARIRPGIEGKTRNCSSNRTVGAHEN